MKVVVQNGANHCLTRKDAEAIVRLLPTAFGSGITQIVLAQGDSLAASFHRKEKLLCLYCPRSPSLARDKAKATLVLLQAMAERSRVELPEALAQTCINAVCASAV